MPTVSSSGDASQPTGSCDGTRQVTTDNGVVTTLHTDRIFIEGATFFLEGELDELPELKPGLMWDPVLEGPDGHYKVVKSLCYRDTWNGMLAHSKEATL